MAAVVATVLAFQFTRPQGARRRPCACRTMRVVSIHAPARGATRLIVFPLYTFLFQFTRPQGARRSALTHPLVSTVFQFTRPQGARQIALRRIIGTGSFNSRARKGRDQRIGPRQFRRYVSIHAPARGATVPSPFPVPNFWRFNSRARKGRDDPGRPITANRPRFNSRARKGRDICDTNTLCQFAVSIHAPARGATLMKSEALARVRFQFTRPQGARLRWCYYRCSPDCFNSRARKGRDASLPAMSPVTPSFNSRARKGRDNSGRAVDRSDRVSIHAPARGATVAFVWATLLTAFQFTRPQGARRYRQTGCSPR